MKYLFICKPVVLVAVLLPFIMSCKKTLEQSPPNNTTGTNIHNVGTGWPYATLAAAAAVAKPGDTIQINNGTYSGGDNITNLQGTSAAWITIRAAKGATVLYSGNTQAFQLSDPAYLRIQGLQFEKQSANGVNIDDAGTFDTPAHDIIIENCEWLDIGGTGNNDLLKLSGVDNFTVQNCRFNNGANGAFIDMVGCHNGVLQDNICKNVGPGGQAFQTKGGSKNIIVQRNRIINGGDRAMHIGGNTGTQYFRPQGANYEAMNIYVYSNTFEGSTAPIVFASAVSCEVVNNTIIQPVKYAVRILQDNNMTQKCANNTFRNNIVVFPNTGSAAINIGVGTDANSFVFSNNLWFNPDNLSWSGPTISYVEPGQILNKDPQFSDAFYHLQSTSPAIGKGYSALKPTTDYFSLAFKSPRSIGAVEAN